MPGVLGSGAYICHNSLSTQVRDVVIQDQTKMYTLCNVTKLAFDDQCPCDYDYSAGPKQCKGDPGPGPLPPGPGPGKGRFGPGGMGPAAGISLGVVGAAAVLMIGAGAFVRRRARHNQHEALLADYPHADDEQSPLLGIRSSNPAFATAPPKYDDKAEMPPQYSPEKSG